MSNLSHYQDLLAGAPDWAIVQVATEVDDLERSLAETRAACDGMRFDKLQKLVHDRITSMNSGSDGSLRLRCANVLNLWVLRKRGMYYRKDAAGYTDNITQAWLITAEEAEKYVIRDEVVKLPASLPFDTCMDAAWKLVEWMLARGFEYDAGGGALHSGTSLLHRFKFCKNGTCVGAVAETMERAICEAFLVANPEPAAT